MVRQYIAHNADSYVTSFIGDLVSRGFNVFVRDRAYLLVFRTEPIRVILRAKKAQPLIFTVERAEAGGEIGMRLSMWTPQQKAFCVLSLAEHRSIIRVQRLFRRQYNLRPREAVPTTRSTGRQYVIWQTYKKEFMLLSTMLHHRCFITLGSRLNTGWIFPVPPMEATLRFMEHKICVCNVCLSSVCPRYQTFPTQSRILNRYESIRNPRSAVVSIPYNGYYVRSESENGPQRWREREKAALVDAGDQRKVVIKSVFNAMRNYNQQCRYDNYIYIILMYRSTYYDISMQIFCVIIR
ncbi:hypothetical protein ANN_25245 [Periplaneta americana]|uniref:DUF4817 domain-containing protein n=1 Tax=Periplaneta americana TaxID=6978 RepID=A0ABQ8S0Y5_PERAM|nr:hypothetical protein ANN_25245 [Periplaneta americana]